MNLSNTLQVTNFMVRRVFIGCIILMIGIIYNLYKDANALYAAFAPLDLPIFFGQTLTYLAFTIALFCSIRMFGFLRNPLVVEATEEGLLMRGIGMIPWEKIHKIWFGTLFGKPQGFSGTFLFIEFLHPIETKKLSFKAGGIYSEQATKSGRYTKVRYWLPFVFPHDKKEFIDVANQYCPHANKNWLE